MIARTWHGRVPASKADAYYDYLRRTGLADYRATAGNRGVLVERRIDGDVAHFTLTSFWDSLDAIKRFAGEPYEAARYYPEDDEYLLEREPSVTHTEVLMLAPSDVSTDVSKRPAIARIWRGRIRPERADEYEAYNYEVGITPLIEKAMGVQTLREDRDGETELVTISYWESVEAMSRFTGGDPRRIHHLPRDAELLIELPERVQTLDIRASHGNTGGDAS